MVFNPSSVRDVLGLLSILLVTQSTVLLASTSDSFTCSAAIWLGVGFLFPPSIKDFLAASGVAVISAFVLVLGSTLFKLASYPAVCLASSAPFSCRSLVISSKYT